MEQDDINNRVMFSTIKKEAEQRAKRNKCVICGEKTTHFAKSHSIPRSVLSNISDQGWLFGFEKAAGISDDEYGLGNAGVFYIICDQCEHKCFNTYEDVKNLKQKPTDRVMAEIALKDSLLQLSDSSIEKQVCFGCIQRGIRSEYYTNRIPVVDKDIECFEECVNLYSNIIENNDTNIFQILFWKLLPYKIPVAIQSQIPTYFDPYGTLINDNYDYSHRTQPYHFAAFPLVDESVIIAFYHRRDTKNKMIRNRFKRLSDSEILEYLYYSAVQSTSNIFYSKQIEEIMQNPEFRVLSREENRLPNLGNGITTWEEWHFAQSRYSPPDKKKIPCLFDESYAIS